MKRIALLLMALMLLGTAQTVTAQKKPVKRTTTTTPRKKPATTQSNQATESFVLGDGKLGPLSLGQTTATLPKKVAGLYDSYKIKTEEFADMDDSWTETYCYFYKGGKAIFKALVNDKKRLESFTLDKGSSFIKTSEGFFVGGSARDLFSKKPMTWETWYTGTAFARKGHWEFHIPSDDLNGADFPAKLSDIKSTAKISMIVYYKSLPQ
jgi:hypothetical protein